MKWRSEQPKNITLIALTLFSILIFYVAEQTAEPMKQPNFEKKLKATKLALLAREAVKSYSQLLGIKVDAQNDPYKTGIIGQERTPITSDRGIVTSKIIAADPNFAAAFVEMLIKAKVKQGDVVAVGMTGSLPGWNISFLAACVALDVKPLIITSVGASDWGANLSALTWLDMERVMNERGIISLKTFAASIGGGADNGRGLSPDGRNLIKEAIQRNSVYYIDEPTLEKNIVKRMELYDQASNGKPIACYINIGGGVASLGGSQNAKLIPPGLTKHLAVMNFPVHAVINQMAERGIPVINLSNVEKIAEKYNISTDIKDKESELGEGSLFFKDHYSVSNIIVLTIILGIVVFIFVRIDVKHYLIKKRISPEIGAS